MKCRMGFVSNSSSCSFTVIFPAKMEKKVWESIGPLARAYFEEMNPEERRIGKTSCLLYQGYYTNEDDELPTQVLLNPELKAVRLKYGIKDDADLHNAVKEFMGDDPSDFFSKLEGELSQALKTIDKLPGCIATTDGGYL